MKPKISIQKATKNKLFYVVATTTIYDPATKKCLILKRSMKEKVHAGKWCVAGGKLEHEDFLPSLKPYPNSNIHFANNMLHELVKREAKEESGLGVKVKHQLDDVVFIRPDLVPVVCLKYASIKTSGKVKIPEEFDNFAWVDAKDVARYDTIRSVIPEVKETINLFGK